MTCCVQTWLHEQTWGSGVHPASGAGSHLCCALPVSLLLFASPQDNTRPDLWALGQTATILSQIREMQGSSQQCSLAKFAFTIWTDLWFLHFNRKFWWLPKWYVGLNLHKLMKNKSTFGIREPVSLSSLSPPGSLMSLCYWGASLSLLRIWSVLASSFNHLEKAYSFS